MTIAVSFDAQPHAAPGHQDAVIAKQGGGSAPKRQERQALVIFPPLIYERTLLRFGQ